MVTIAPRIIGAAQAAKAKWKLPTSIQLAQYGLESGWGVHDLGVFNFFGMKAPTDEHGKVLPGIAYVTLSTKEEDKYGHEYTIKAPFRKFGSPEEAFDLHAKLLATAKVYAPAFAALPDLHRFVALMAPRYATAHDYATQLFVVINSAGLTKYD